MADLRSAGQDPYAYSFQRTHTAAQLQQQFASLEDGQVSYLAEHTGIPFAYSFQLMHTAEQLQQQLAGLEDRQVSSCREHSCLGISVAVHTLLQAKAYSCAAAGR